MAYSASFKFDMDKFAPQNSLDIEEENKIDAMEEQYESVQREMEMLKKKIEEEKRNIALKKAEMAEKERKKREASLIEEENKKIMQKKAEEKAVMLMQAKFEAERNSGRSDFQTPGDSVYSNSKKNMPPQERLSQQGTSFESVLKNLLNAQSQKSLPQLNKAHGGDKENPINSESKTVESESKSINSEPSESDGSKKWVLGDKTVPENWKTCREIIVVNGKKKKKISFLSPNGQYFGSRRKAVEFMIKRKWKKDDIDHMSAIWLKGIKGVTQINNNQVKVKQEKGVQKAQIKNEPEQTRTPIINQLPKPIDFKSTQKSIQTPRLAESNDGSYSKEGKVLSKSTQWIVGDTSVPADWKYCKEDYMNTEGYVQMVEYFCSPEGQIFNKREEALNFMITRKIVSHKDILLMKRFIRDNDKIHSKNWILSDDSVPAGWKVCKEDSESNIKRTLFASPDWQFFYTRKVAVEFMIKNNYAEEDIVLMNSYLEKGIQGIAKVNIKYRKMNWIEGDKTVPGGWKLSKVESITGVTRTYLCSPDGQYFNSRREAVDYMRKNQCDEADIRLMKKDHSKSEKNNQMYLNMDWVVGDKTVPNGWKIFREDHKFGNIQGKRSFFASPDGQFFNSRRLAVEFMITNKHEQKDIELMNFYLTKGIPGVSKEIFRIKEKFDKQSSVQEELANKNWILDDETVPAGWKVAREEAFIGNRPILKQYFCSPDELYFPSRRQAYDYMMESFYPQDEVEHMGKLLEVKPKPNQIPQKERNWVSGHPSVPEGWKICREDVNLFGTTRTVSYFCSPDNQFFSSARRVVEFMTANNYGAQYVEMMRGHIKRNKGPQSLEAKTFIKDEDSLPPGWKVCREEVFINGVKKIRTYFASPNEQYFNSGKLAIDFMRANGYSENDQLSIKRYLDHREHNSSSVLNTREMETKNWKTDENLLPPGWKVCQEDFHMSEGNKKIRTYFCSPDGQYFNSGKLASNFMKANGYSENDQLLVRRFWYHREYSNGTDSPEYIRQMEMKNWITDESALPPGWKACQEELYFNGLKKVRTYFSSPEGQYFNSAKLATTFMGSNGYSEKDQYLIRRYVDHREFRNSAPIDSAEYIRRMERKNWTMDENALPTGWKVCQEDLYVNGLKKVRTYFSSPDGQYFNSGKLARVYMRAHDYSEHDQYLIRRYVDRREYSASNFNRKDMEMKNWTEDDSILPQGWKACRENFYVSGVKKFRTYFASNTGQYFNSGKNAILFMRENNYSENDQYLIRRYVDRRGLSRGVSMSNRKRSSIDYDKIKWLVGHPTLPDGWKIRQRYDNDFRTAFLSPCGQIFLSRRRVLEFMQNDPSYTEADFVKVRSGSKIFRDSIEHPGLPTGWRCRLSTSTNLISFISPKAKKILTNMNIKSSEAYKALSEEDKLKIDGFFTANKMTIKQRMSKKWSEAKDKSVQKRAFLRYYIKRYHRSSEPEMQDPELPEGWMRKTIGGLKYYKAPTGQVFMSRKAAFEFIENGTNDVLPEITPEDLKDPGKKKGRGRPVSSGLYVGVRGRPKRKKEKSVDSPDWEDAGPEMPPGWTKRVRFGKNGKANQLNYMTPNGTIFPSKLSAIEHLKSLSKLANNDYTVKEEFSEDRIMDKETYQQMYGKQQRSMDTGLYQEMDASQGIMNDGTYPGMIMDNGTYPNMIMNNGTYPNMIMDNATYPPMMVNNGTYSGTYPDMAMNNGTYPDMAMNNGTYPDMAMNSGTYPDMSMNNGSYPDLGMNNGSYQDASTHSNMSNIEMNLMSGLPNPGEGSEEMKPRVAVMPEDLKFLLPAFTLNPNPDMVIVESLSKDTGLPVVTIMSWFESRRNYFMEMPNQEQVTLI